MMRLIQLSIIILATCLTGCTSTRGYFIDRGRDVLDVATFGIEKNCVGATVQAGPLMTGLSGTTAPENECTGFGLRGGQLGVYSSFDTELILVGYKFFEPRGDVRHKEYETMQLVFINTGRDIFGGRKHRSVYQYGNVEVSASLGVGIRGGFNIIEALDFALGWTTIDILDDDIGKK